MPRENDITDQLDQFQQHVLRQKNANSDRLDPSDIANWCESPYLMAYGGLIMCRRCGWYAAGE